MRQQKEIELLVYCLFTVRDVRRTNEGKSKKKLKENCLTMQKPNRNYYMRGERKRIVERKSSVISVNDPPIVISISARTPSSEPLFIAADYSLAFIFVVFFSPNIDSTE